jgi:hypothetical protein
MRKKREKSGEMIRRAKDWAIIRLISKLGFVRFFSHSSSLPFFFRFHRGWKIDCLPRKGIRVVFVEIRLWVKRDRERARETQGEGVCEEEAGDRWIDIVY